MCEVFKKKNNWIRTKEIILTGGEEGELYSHKKESETIYVKRKKSQSTIIIL